MNQVIATSMHEAAARPIVLWGKELRQAKAFLHGTHRSRTPEETVARIRPHFARMGVTRLANVTGLDRVGIPTVLAIRPNSNGLSVDAGKGLSIAAATASAAMESVERWHAESAELASFQCSYAALEQTHHTIPFERLPLIRDSWFHRNWPVHWTLAFDIVHEREVAVPAELTTLNTHAESAFDVGIFQKGSNGLSGGNVMLEAILSGLLEVIERDGVTCHAHALACSGRPMLRVDLNTVEDANARALLEKFERAGILPVVRDCTTDLGVPTYLADIYDLEVRNRGVFRGYGAHLDPNIALTRALTEAAQARLVHTAGSRDDFFAADLRRLQRANDAAQLTRLRGERPDVPLRRRTLEIAQSFEADIRLLLGILARAGLDQVLVTDLTAPGFEADLAAVRVMVPGLEGYYFDHYAPGARARAFAERGRS